MPERQKDKFRRGNPEDGKHYWLTPPELLRVLDEEFRFDFDPCPYPLPKGFDGLSCDWGRSNYVNPPFAPVPVAIGGRKVGITAWARKAIAEFEKGKRIVLVSPVDKWVLMLLGAGAKVRNLGDVKCCAVEDGTPSQGIGRHIACFILDPERSGSKEQRRAKAMRER